MTKVRVIKDNIEVGWFKDLQPGINCIIETCKLHKFDISLYKLVDYYDSKVLWTGESIVD